MYIYACTHADRSCGGVPAGGWAEEQLQGVWAFSQPREKHYLEPAESECVLKGGRKILQLGQGPSQFSLHLQMFCRTALSHSLLLPGLSFSTNFSNFVFGPGMDLIL